MSKDENSYICPVCGYDNLDELPYDEYENPSYEICPCCGFEFGFDDLDQGYSFEKYRDKWIKDGWNWFNPGEKPENWDRIKQLCNIGTLLVPFYKMDILQIRDGLHRIGTINLLNLNRNDTQRIVQCSISLAKEFETKLKETNNQILLLNIIEEDNKNYDMSVELMFLVYQRLIELQPQKENVLAFLDYLHIFSGPDWTEEMEEMKKSIAEENILKAVDVALKVDYHK